MTWHTVSVAEYELDHLLCLIRRAGGSIAHTFPRQDRYTVIYSTRED